MSYHYKANHKKARENLSKKASGLSTKNKIKGLESKPIHGTITGILRDLDIDIITPIKDHIDNSRPMKINQNRNILKFTHKTKSSSGRKNFGLKVFNSLVLIISKLFKRKIDKK